MSDWFLPNLKLISFNNCLHIQVFPLSVAPGNKNDLRSPKTSTYLQQFVSRPVFTNINSIQWSIYHEFMNSGLPDNIWAIGNSLTYIFDKMVPMVWWSGKGVSKWIMKKVQKVLYNGVLYCIMIKYLCLYCWYVYHTTMGRISIIKLTIGNLNRVGINFFVPEGSFQVYKSYTYKPLSLFVT